MSDIFSFRERERIRKGELNMKDMKKTAALLAAMALLGVGSASAAEALRCHALKGITVTTTRQAESLKDVPANVQVITEKGHQAAQCTDCF